jgi:hypothetical protein
MRMRGARAGAKEHRPLLPVWEHCADVGRERRLGPNPSRVGPLRPRQGRVHCGR